MRAPGALRLLAVACACAQAAPDAGDSSCTAGSGDDETCALQVRQTESLGLPPAAKDLPWDNLHLFDLSKDPSEREDIVESHPMTAYSLTSKLYAETKFTQKPVMPLYAGEPLPQAVFDYLLQQGGTVPWKEAIAGKPRPPKPPALEQPGCVKPKRNAPNIVFILVDDWGWNDPGFLSTYASFTMPNINKMKDRGVMMDRYYTGRTCAPSRAMLLTGRHSHHIGFQKNPPFPILRPDETTMAQELKAVGYHTALVGKWHMGYQDWLQTPTYRGFDDFYGYYAGDIDFYSYSSEPTHFDDRIPDLTNGTELAADRFNGEHITLRLSRRAAQIIGEHRGKYGDTPLFLYYAEMAVHNDHNGYSTPKKYFDYCKQATVNPIPGPPVPPVDDHETYYCALQIMLDEAVGNVLTALESADMMKNTVVVLSGDNGGNGVRLPPGEGPPFAAPYIFQGFIGANYPLLGTKSNLADGAFRNHAIVYAGERLIPRRRRGATYSGLVHITDWLPTFMGLAAKGWRKALSGFRIDGKDQWDSIVKGTPSPHKELILNWNPEPNEDGEFVSNAPKSAGAIIVDYCHKPWKNDKLRKLIVGNYSMYNWDDPRIVWMTPVRVTFELNGVLPEPTWGLSN